MKTVCSDDSDDALMERAAGGDTTAFDQIVKRHQHRLQRFATRMLGGDSAQGADVAVGAMLRLWEKRLEYHPCGRLSSLLLQLTYRLSLDAVRRKRPAEDIERAEPISESPVFGIERTALAGAVRDAVMEMPEDQRAVVVLSVYEGLSYDAISEALAIPIGTVASRKNHALATLRRRLAAWEDR